MTFAFLLQERIENDEKQEFLIWCKLPLSDKRYLSSELLNDVKIKYMV